MVVLLLFAISQGFDLYTDIIYQEPDPFVVDARLVVLEEGFKTLALVALCTYGFRLGLRSVETLLTAHRSLPE
jgi:hypothetical protein